MGKELPQRPNIFDKTQVFRIKYRQLKRSPVKPAAILVSFILSFAAIHLHQGKQEVTPRIQVAAPLIEKRPNEIKRSPASIEIKQDMNKATYSEDQAKLAGPEESEHIIPSDYEHDYTSSETSEENSLSFEDIR